MAHVRIEHDPSPDSRLAALYREVADPRTGQVDEILAVHSLHEAGFAAHYALYKAVMTGTPGLRKVEREMIAVVVSRTNGCHY